MRYEVDNMMGVKRTNRSAALCILHEHGSISRKRLAETTKLSPAAITKIVAEMISEGILSEGRTLPSGGVGRREVMVELNTHARCALGILLNLRQAIISAVWMDGSVIFSEEVSLVPHAPADETVRMLSQRLLELVAEFRLDPNTILGLGIAMRGVTTSDGRTVQNSFGAIDQENYPICQRFEHYTRYPTIMSNNVQALFAAHMFLSKDKDIDSQFFLRCEFGIGASLSINGKIWQGSTNQCSEIGHLPVIRRGGKPCSCGKCGCLETISSPTAIREDAIAILSEKDTPVLYKICRGKSTEEITLDDVFNAARNGDSRVADIVDNAIYHLSSALKSVIYTIDPGKIVLYGRMFENSYCLAKIMAEMREGVDTGHNFIIEKSRFNLQLEKNAAGLLVVKDFFNKGGIL